MSAIIRALMFEPEWQQSESTSTRLSAGKAGPERVELVVDELAVEEAERLVLEVVGVAPAPRRR